MWTRTRTIARISEHGLDIARPFLYPSTLMFPDLQRTSISPVVLLIISLLIPSRMLKLLDPAKDVKHIDLTLGFESGSDDSDELPCPPVRYIF